MLSTCFCYKISHCKVNTVLYGNNSSSSADAKNSLDISNFMQRSFHTDIILNDLSPSIFIDQLYAARVIHRFYR